MANFLGEVTIDGKSDCGFFSWEALFPQAAAVKAAHGAVAAELGAASSCRWHEWPETNLYMRNEGAEWNVIPFCYTFPADGSTPTTWVESSCALLPRTAALLRALGPSLRTALFSRLGPETTLAPHDGWAELSNHVLRCHLAVDIPEPGASGVAVEGTVQLHTQGEILCFDDSRVHSGFNNSPTHPRTVLIFDLARPPGCRPGRATLGATKELANFMAYFN